MKFTPKDLFFTTLAVVAIILIIGTVVGSNFSTSHPKLIKLVPGAEASFDVVRLQPQTPQFSLLFKEKKYMARPELGTRRFNADASDPQFDKQLANVMLEIRVANASIDYETLPGISGEGKSRVRKLTPTPSNNGVTQLLNPLTTKVVVKIKQVDDRLLNEEVTLRLRPPIWHKSTQPGYEVFFWLLMLAPLTILAGVLLFVWVFLYFLKRRNESTQQH
jgi:hypothetical protein